MKIQPGIALCALEEHFSRGGKIFPHKSQTLD